MNKYYYRLFDIEKFCESLPEMKHRSGPKGGGKKRFKDAVFCFDIETSRIFEEQSICYLWQLAIDENTVIYGRNLNSFRDYLDTIASTLDTGTFIVIYVHNLAYEIQYLTGILDFDYDDIFWLKSRRPLKAVYKNKIEFRCSYMLSGKSLAVWCDDLDVKHKKLSGDDFDYKAVRYPWTKLTDKQLQYGFHDVLGLRECIIKTFEMRHDTLESTPLTKTGYVRRDVKKAMGVCRKSVKNLHPDYETFKMLESAFRGGNTHANRWRTGIIIKDVHSYDIASSYPFQILTKKFPITPFTKPPRTVQESDLQKYMDIGRAFVCTAVFKNIRLADEFIPVPYIPHSKTICYGDFSRDNGRILHADKMQMTFTDIDYKIIKNQYIWDGDAQILDIRLSRYGELPKPLKDACYHYFEIKTKLKGATDPHEQFLYSMAKADLNSIYGMMVENPLKPFIYFDCQSGKYTQETVTNPIQKLEKRQKSMACPYQWGVWVTAHARADLQEMIDALYDEDGFNDLVYTDTDSVKFTGDFDAVFDRVNKRKMKEGLSYKATTNKGKVKYLGVFEKEETAKRFITLGAKKYCYEGQDGDLHLTVSGVTKAKGAKELGKIENFKIGFNFTIAGGTRIAYNDAYDNGEIIADGRHLRIGRNCTILDTTYKLGIADEYERLLWSLDIWG